MTNDTIVCADCGATCKPRGIGTGCAVTRDDKRVCYRCAAKRERADMVKDGRACLYVVEYHDNRCTEKQAGTGWQCNMASHYRVTSWPGDLMGTATWVKHGRHNIAGHRLDVWFTGPDDKPWHGVNIGDNQVLRCKRLKSK